ncbi:MAG: DUF2865 domain-containing protein [Methyloligellaceae bacterium]
MTRRSWALGTWSGLVALGLASLGGSILTVPAAQAQNYRNGQQQPGYQRQYTPQQLQCIRLENELANNWLKDQNPQKDPTKQLRAQVRKYDRIFQTTQAQANRSRCYENVFIFGRALVRTPKCIRMHNRIEDARRQLSRLRQELEQARQRRSGAGRQQRKDDLVEALARNGCGAQYQRESRRRRGLFGWFTEDDTFRDREPRRDLETSTIVPYATYRTLCVRQCDGYYFPISFSTLPSRFQSDLQKCISQCAAPAQLYVYRNPGEEPEQMVSTDGKAYSQQPYAFRYRKEYIKGCSCKVAEYNPEDISNHGKKPEAGEQKSGAAPAQGGTAAKVVKDASGKIKQQ